MEIITLSVAFVSVVISVIATFAAWRSVEIAHSALGADIMYKFFERYGSDEMAFALRTLRDWENRNGANFDSIWLERVKKGDSEALEVDRARREVLYYFRTALRLHKAGALSKKFLKEIADLDGLTIEETIVEKLTAKLYPNTRDVGIANEIRLTVHTSNIPLWDPIPPSPKNGQAK